MGKGSSKKPEQAGRPQAPGLSDEDMLLWQHMARTLRPFKGRDRHVLPGGFDEQGFKPHASNTGSEAPKVLPGYPDQPPRQNPVALTRDTQRKSVPELAKFDNRKARKIRAGRIDIEAKLDLHGMRQHEAHGALRAFLLRSRARHLKWVLVITGKGTFARDGQHDDRLGSDWDAPPRGVLRQNVPMWLSEPEVRAVVVSYTTAAVHHGGEGALYIQLRSNKK